MSHPLYLNGVPLVGHITYLCPECLEELSRGQQCPHCDKTAVAYNKDFDKEIERQEIRRYIDERDLLNAGWPRR